MTEIDGGSSDAAAATNSDNARPAARAISPRWQTAHAGAYAVGQRNRRDMPAAQALASGARRRTSGADTLIADINTNRRLYD
jgi:hypothetical protein